MLCYAHDAIISKPDTAYYVYYYHHNTNVPYLVIILAIAKDVHNYDYSNATELN